VLGATEEAVAVLSVLKRIRGYQRRAFWELHQFIETQKKARLERHYRRWQQEFRRSSAELLIGANFDAGGGVRNHIHAIHRYSSLKSELVPGERHRLRCPMVVFRGHQQDFRNVAPSSSLKAVHSHVSPWFIDWCGAHRSHQIRWVHTHHLLYYDETNPGGMPDWQRDLNEAGVRALRSCDVPLVVSRSQQRALKSLYGIDTAYLPNGVDVADCDRGTGVAFRRRYGVARDFVLWMGRNDPVKNPREFLLAAADLPTVQFVMAGDGCSESELTASTGCSVPPNVLLTGPLSRQVAQDALAACQVLCVTSVREGLPTLILEGMAHRRRVVTSDAEGCLDATDGEAFATVYRRGDVSALCAAIQRALVETQDVEAGRRRVLLEFDWRVVARKLDQIYLTGSV
jgi:glycosyltransferase involved in cell wall biosynthesis